MNDKFFVRSSPPKKFHRQRGQIILLSALLIPLLFLFAGVGLDLGWYYLNTSRLQNAADAAVLAGAKELLNNLKSNNSKYKSYNITLVYKYPADSPYTITSSTKSSTESATDITTEIKSTADKIALEYAQKNLSSDDTGFIQQSFFSVAEAADSDEISIEDSWARKNKYNEIKMKIPEIYKDGEDFYYVVRLEENIQHFFMPGRFEPMEAPVVAIAKLSKATSSSNGTPKVVFDPNGGHFVNPTDGSTTTETLSIGDITKTIEESGSAAVIVPDGYSSTPERDEYEFLRYWTNADGLIVPYGTVLTEDNIEEFFKTYDPDAKDNDDYDYTSGTIILYAQWVKVKQQPVTLLFDPNGGSFSDGTATPDSKQIKNPSEMEDDETTDPITPNKGIPLREGYEFYGWSTDKSANANSLIANYISDGKQLTKNEITNLFGGNTSVTLYAVWKNINSTVSEEEEEEVNLKPHNNKTLWEQMHYLIAKYVYDPDWNVSVNKFGAALNDLNFIPTGNTAVLNNNKIVSITMKADTKANNSGAYVKDVDKLFLDFRPDGFIIRVHALIEVNAAYDVRSEKSGDDPLYIRIEAEPKIGSTGNEPQQIIINICADNTADSKRPLFFYYDGPLTYNGTYPDRVAQPVILNLTTDFKGVLFMPEVPVVIHGNGKKFEGFIVAKEFRYAATSGSKTAKYTKNGIAAYYYIDSDNNIQTDKATGSNALELYTNNATDKSKFNLSDSSKFKTFTAESNVNFMYVFYGYDTDATMVEEPFHEYYDLDNDLIPLYKLDAAGNQVRVTNWSDVKLYDSDDFETRNEIPKDFSGETSQVKKNKQGTVRLTDGSPSPLYDEAGNPVYFCEDYVKLTGTYTVFTLDKVADGTRDEKEFLLTADTANVSAATNVPNTDDWK